MTKNKGWFKIHRKIQENWMWLSEPFTRAQAWIDLILLANHEEENKFYIRGNQIVLKNGQIGWAKENLALRWKWSRKKVLNFLNLLEKEQQITQQKTASLVIVTIINYSEYQKKEQQTTQQKNNRRTTEEQQTTHNQELKELKELKEEKENIKEKSDISDLPIFINQKLWDQFLELRRKLKKPLTEGGIEQNIKKLINFEKRKAGNANKALENSIAGSWQGLFEPKESTNSFNKPTKSEINREILNNFINNDNG